MMARGLKGAMIYGILGTTIIGGWIVGASDPYNGVAAVDVGSFDNFDSGALFEVAGLPEESMFAAIGALGDLNGDNLGDFILVMPHGKKISCKGWLQEAALRMLSKD